MSLCGHLRLLRSGFACDARADGSRRRRNPDRQRIRRELFATLRGLVAHLPRLRYR
jgi:hypothetical protein